RSLWVDDDGSGGSDTDSGGDGEGDLDLLRDEDGKSDGDGEDDDGKSDGGEDDDGAGLMGKVVISSAESDMMTNRMSTPARGVVVGKGVGRGVVIVL
ncbi:hypothetical protein Tco_0647491, partial [Tanacetum coccineum]